MVAKPSGLLSRSGRNDYSPSQRLILAFWLFDLWDRLGFGSSFEGDGKRYMQRLLIGCCIAAMKGRPMSVTEAFDVMDAKHGRTANKYIDAAESRGLIKKGNDPDGDLRKTVLVPTETLQKNFNLEIARLGDDMREVAAALLQEGNLPDTGAPDLALKVRRNPRNRHGERADSTLHIPVRGGGWGVGVYET